MLSKKENLLETLKIDGKPDRLVKQFEGTVFLPGDPVNTFVRGNRYPGMPPIQDLWGTTILWPEGSIGAMPHVTEENKVVRDITCWREFTKVPDLIANCSAEDLWAPYFERVAQVDRGENLLMMFAPTGLFERTHFLMGFEDTFLNIMIEPEAMEDLEAAIGEYRYNGMKLMTDIVHPDMILSHDDWGSKTNLFMRPDQWREYIKVNYQKTYDYRGCRCSPRTKRSTMRSNGRSCGGRKRSNWPRSSAPCGWRDVRTERRLPCSRRIRKSAAPSSLTSC